MNELLSSLRDRVRAILADPAFRWSVTVYIGVRVVLSVVAATVFLMGMVPLPTSDPALLEHYYEIEPVTEGLPGMLFGVWQRFDAINYQRIALNGYSVPELSVFFPLFPFLMRPVAFILGNDTLLAGLVVANLCFVGSLYLFFKLILEEGYGMATARRAVVYLACAPVAFFFFAGFTESLLLLCVLYTFRETRRGNWLRAGSAAALAALTRPQGFCVIVPLAWEFGRQNKWRIRQMMQWKAIVVLWPGLSVALFLLWRWWVGFPPLPQILTNWNRVAAIPGAAIIWTLERMIGGEAMLVEYSDLICVVSMIGLGIVAIKRLPLAYTLYFWAVLLFSLYSPQLDQPLSAQMRYSLVLFPAFMLLGQAGRKPVVNRLILYPFCAALLFWVGPFVMWGWIG